MAENLPWNNGEQVPNPPEPAAIDWSLVDAEPRPGRLPWTDDAPAVDPEQPATPPRDGMKARLARRAAGVALIAAVAGFAGGKIGAPDQPAAERRPTTGSAATPAPAATTADLEALYRDVSPSVVQIVTSGGRRGEGSGSGVIIDTQGTILTNDHVVSGGTVRVELADDRRFVAEVVGRDPQFDLAVVRIVNPPDDLIPARLGDSSAVEPGQTVVAIGAPFGLQGSITAGIVSAVNRTFQGNEDYPAMRGLIQTDAAINPGNSGGPLLNTAGEVVGITTAIESPVRGSVGVGFAVPIEQAQRALPLLVSGTVVRHPYLGISGDPASGGGVTITEIGAGTSADDANLRVGDVIEAIAGRAVNSIDELARELDRHAVGDTVTLLVRRGSRDISVDVTLKPFRLGG